MCELFGLSAARLMAASELPLAVFRERGGGTADNPDGWGLAWREGKRFSLEKAPEAACRSARFGELLRGWQGDLAIAHVRRANYPPINSLTNTHPFLHDCCDRQWAFAHNGLVPGVMGEAAACHPLGETDSESAFCRLLSDIARHSGTIGAGLLDGLGEMGEAIARHGQFNFLLSDGEHLIAYGHDRLHYLESAGEAVVLIATTPLSRHAGWTAFAPGELRIYRAGQLLRRIPTHPPAPHSLPEAASA